jgi:hypothetical protein
VSWRVVLVSTALLACGASKGPAPAPPPPEPPRDSPRDQPAEPPDQAKREELAAAHRKLESEHQDALAATCSNAEPRSDHERCLPSCYRTEPVDPRAGKPPKGPVAIAHLVCQKPGATEEPAPLVMADEIAAVARVIRPVRGRFPKPHKQGTWQATVASSFLDAHGIKPRSGDVIAVAGSWRPYTHPLTKQRLRCVTLSHHTKALRSAIDGCGGLGRLVCEATGNAAARGINVVHYRVAEARRLKTSGKTKECQQAALEAIAVSRGMPRWRQYAALNVGNWDEQARYRTRFDGILDEEALFVTVASLGSEAEAIHRACGGPAGAPTTVDNEQSFHSCW